MRLAVVVGGWHWPDHFYRAASIGLSADLFVVAHRSPELPIVSEEKRVILDAAESSPLVYVDKMLYSSSPTVRQLKRDGWNYMEAPNTVGDWGFFNQWLEKFDYREYDVILNCHDDTWVRNWSGLIAHMLETEDWLILSNGTYPECPQAYVRGSFEFWTKEMLDLLGGKIDLGTITLTREGLTDSPREMEALFPWNDAGIPLRRFLVDRGLMGRVKSLSQYYRVSQWAIEGERGFMHYNVGVPWSFEAGLKAYPV